MAILLLLVLIPPVAGQEMEYVSSTLHHNPYYSIGKVGEYVYCGGRNGLHIFDITDPENPTLAKICDFPYIRMMFIDGQYTYLISHQEFYPLGLRILDVSVPLEPQIISELLRPIGDGSTVRYYDNTIYTHYGWYDSLTYPTTVIVTIDVSDPFEPLVSDSLIYPNSLSAMWASDGYLHVTTTTFDWAPNHWHILSLSNPAHPNHLQTMNFGQEYIFEISAYQQYIYLGMSSGANIYDISNPLNPQLVRIDSTSGFNSLLALNDTVAFTGWHNGIKTFNLSNPVYPVQMGYANISDDPYSFYNFGDTCFATTIDFYGDNASKFNIIDFTDPYFPSIIGEHWTAGYSYDVQIAGDYAYIANGTSGLKIVDISNPEEPVILDNEIGTGAKDILIQGNRLYLLRGRGRFEIYDISIPDQAVLLGFNNDNINIAYNIFADGDYAYVTKMPYNNAYAGFLSIYDLSDPSNPAPTYSIENLHWPRYVIMDNGYAYISCYDDLKIYNVSNLDSITFVSSYQYGNQGYQLSIDYPYLYMASSYTALEILNIEDPANPYIKSRISGAPFDLCSFKWLVSRRGNRQGELHIRSCPPFLPDPAHYPHRDRGGQHIES
jgi:hypothetical protein